MWQLRVMPFQSWHKSKRWVASVLGGKQNAAAARLGAARAAADARSCSARGRSRSPHRGSSARGRSRTPRRNRRRRREPQAAAGRRRAFGQGQPGANPEAALTTARLGEGGRALAGLARAPTTTTAKEARLRTWDRLSAEAGFAVGSRLTPAALEAVGGALIAGGYSSAHLYAGDALQRHRRDGGIVSGQLEEFIKDIKRAAKKLPRGRRARGSLGPLPRLAAGTWPTMVGGPAHSRTCGLTATWWLLRDISLIDLNRNDVQLLRGAVALTFTCDKAATPTATRIHSCVCGGARGTDLAAVCPACLLKDHVAALEAEHLAKRGGSYPGEAPLFPALEEDGMSYLVWRRPTTAAMYAWVDGIAAAQGFSPHNADGTRRFGRHVWRRTGAAWLRRLIPREDLAALGNWTSAAIDAYLQEADPWDTAGIAGRALGARGPASVAAGLVEVSGSDTGGRDSGTETSGNDELEGEGSGSSVADSDVGEGPGLGHGAAGGEGEPRSRSEGPWAAATGLWARTCRFCTATRLGAEMYPASICAMCEGGPYHAVCLYRGACAECGPAHPGMRAAGSGRADAPWAVGDLVRAAAGGPIHRIKTASAEYPASRWRTLCGWTFAEAGVRPSSAETLVTCRVCAGRKRAAE